MPELDYNLALAIVFGAVVLYYLARLLIAPARFALRVVGTGVFGVVVLFLFNLVGGFFSTVIGINAITALIVGFMGIPGLAMILLLQRMLS